jgi:hypothetical protein
MIFRRLHSAKSKSGIERLGNLFSPLVIPSSYHHSCVVLTVVAQKPSTRPFVCTEGKLAVPRFVAPACKTSLSSRQLSDIAHVEMALRDSRLRLRQPCVAQGLLEMLSNSTDVGERQPSWAQLESSAAEQEREQVYRASRRSGIEQIGAFVSASYARRIRQWWADGLCSF